MAARIDVPESAAAEVGGGWRGPRRPSRWGAALLNVAAHDWIALGYLALVPLALAFAGPWTEAHGRLVIRHSILLALVAGAVVAARLEARPRSWVVAGMYRSALLSAMSVTYLFLGEALPLLNPGALDRELYQLDLRLLGVEPAVLLERWATPWTTDWFSFFYMGYFALHAFFVIPIAFLARNRRLGAELAFAMMFVYALGQSIYVLVPGYGPLRALTDAFHAELPGGSVFQAMHAFVDDAGAMKDIFPSLHTAVPTTLTLIAFRHRRVLGRAWIPVAFVTANTVVATMFLRWHYLVDVLAGLALAFATASVAVRVVDWEERRRARTGLPDAWPEWPSRERL